MLPARSRYLLYLCLAAVNTALLVLVVSGAPACLPGPSAFIYGTAHRRSIAPRTASHTHQLLRVELSGRLHCRDIHRRAPASLTRDSARSSTATASGILAHVRGAWQPRGSHRPLSPPTPPRSINNVQGAPRAMNAPALRPSSSESRISCATASSVL